MVNTATDQNGDKSKRRRQNGDKMAWSNGDNLKRRQVKTATRKRRQKGMVKRRQSKTANSHNGDTNLSQMLLNALLLKVR